MTQASMAKVTITYCAECGYEPQTLALTETLMKTFAHQLTAIELVPWYEGSFDVAVDGNLVHSMYSDGGFPDHKKIVEAVKTRLADASTTSSESA
jgi:selenoprotein W-related protein